ncbi:MAG: outer membrane lipoprotein-sorting protein [Acidobacteria bacterium]|nr:outer membrane lipoprotein-sorting protein [Acidobacteriota bacterium]
MHSTRMLLFSSIMITSLLPAPQRVIAKTSDDTAVASVKSPSLEKLLSQLVTFNEQRDSALVGYSGMREYQAGNGLTRARAEMRVKVIFHNPGSKDFTIISENGSKVIRKRVFLPAMEAEKDAMRSDLRQRSAITPDNYDFTLVGTEDLRDHRCFVLEARPKRKDKYLLRSQIWIDAADYSVVRIKGELVKLPSFWTRKVRFMRDYQKVGDFWLPMRDESITQLLILGRSTMTVRYYDYVITTKTPEEIFPPAARILE